jgi:hypothetical protein
MVENLEHLIRRAARDPRASRASLYKELMRSETYLLTVDEPLAEGVVKKVSRPDASFPVWADKDPEFGGVWVPVFPARDRVREFVLARALRAPSGKEFLWMGHLPGQVFGLLRGVRRFAGIRLRLDDEACVSLSWSEVRALSEGRAPVDSPRLFELPQDRLVIPAGARLSFGRLAPWEGEPKPVLLSMPGAGKFRPEDLRRLVRLPLGEGHAWTPCRHYLQMLKALRGNEEEGGRWLEGLLGAMIAFEMYGEAEAMCDWLEHRGQRAYAWLALSAVYGRSGRMEECADLCRRALERFPGEKAFHLNGLRALIALGRLEEAQRRALSARELFPGDQAVEALLHELGTPSAPAA